MAQARIVMPATANRGQIIEIKTIIQHIMETGHRRDPTGAPIGRDLVNRLTVTYAGTQVFRADLNPGISANPFLGFFLVATETGDLVFEWVGDSQFNVRETRRLTVV